MSIAAAYSRRRRAAIATRTPAPAACAPPAERKPGAARSCTAAASCVMLAIVLIRRAKIVCTIGPASDDQATLEQLIKAGMDVARQNFSHGTHEEHARRLSTIRAAADACGRPVAILQDL